MLGGVWREIEETRPNDCGKNAKNKGWRRHENGWTKAAKRRRKYGRKCNHRAACARQKNQNPKQAWPYAVRKNSVQRLAHFFSNFTSKNWWFGSPRMEICCSYVFMSASSTLMICLPRFR